MKKVWEEVESSLKLASEQMKHFYNKHHSESRNYQIGDKVWLEGQNITTDCPSKTLDDRCHRPFSIVAKIGKLSYKLKLPKTWKNLHPVFNEIFLMPYHAPSQPQPERPLPSIVEKGIEHYDVKEIMDSQLKHGKLQYLVQWEGFPERHEWTWEPLSNVKHVTESIDKFHFAHPSAPRSVDINTIHFISIPESNQFGNTHIPLWVDGKKI